MARLKQRVKDLRALFRDFCVVTCVLARVMVFPMTDMPDLPVQMSFVRWLHGQAKADQAREMPYADLYRWGKNIHEIVGADGTFDANYVVRELAQQGATSEVVQAMVHAEAAWRTDSIIENAEITGVSLDVGESKSISTEIEASEPTSLCGFRNTRGEGCVRLAVPGAGRCGGHGGSITDPEVRRSLHIIAFSKVIQGSEVAVDALLDVAENGRSEMARVQAAKEILDRAGVQQDQHVHIHKPAEDLSEAEMLEELFKRLDTNADRLRIQAIPVESHEITEVPEQFALPVRSGGDDEVVIAEVVEDRV
jgi:hypothetical protein